MYRYIVFIGLMISCVITVHSQDFTSFDFLDLLSCGSCVSYSPDSRWCADPSYTSRRRCNHVQSMQGSCSEHGIISHQDEFLKVNKDEQLTDITPDISEPIQIRPQELSIGLSPHKTMSFTFDYRPARNYPLDLYFLMDLTWTMRDDKETISKLGQELLKTLKSLTADFKIGFGSYVEKLMIPFVLTTDKFKENPCSLEGETCEPTYTFRHRLKITDDIDRFSQTVGNSSVSSNLDNVEAGSEALLQAIVCGEKIGWRSTSRKIILLATDSELHFAGDGKLGGATNINDKQCRINDQGEYIDDLAMDYPSLEQLYRVLLEEKISVIFAVPKNIVPQYEALKKLLPENVFVGELSESSSNILNLVKVGYEQITSVINFEDNSDDSLKLKYYSKCGFENSVLYETNRCGNIESGRLYEFQVNMTMERCPINFKNEVKKVVISESRLGLDALEIDVELLCGCNCEPNDLETVCPPNSEYNCGTCVCLDGWAGDNCDCNLRNTTAASNLKCIAENDFQPCSGLGDCLCGTCQCDPGYTGTFCQCRQCPKSQQGIECGGRSQGQCRCGECICREGWFGPSCSCPESDCVAPWHQNDSLVCSGRGSCDCDNCRCREVNGMQFGGKYCETCLNCTSPACALYEDCIKVSVYPDLHQNLTCSLENGSYFQCDDKEIPCPNRNWNFCEYLDAYGCRQSFMYHIKRDLTVELKISYLSCHLMAGYEKAYGFSVLILTLLLGLLGIIAYKCYIVRQDKREFAEFERHEREAMAMSESNPLYRSPVVESVIPEGYKAQFTNL